MDITKEEHERDVRKVTDYIMKNYRARPDKRQTLGEFVLAEIDAALARGKAEMAQLPER